MSILDVHNIISFIQDVYCKLCHRTVAGRQSTDTLVAHTRNHFRIKHLKCSACLYSSQETKHIIDHIRHKHADLDAVPVDTRFVEQSFAGRVCDPMVVGSILENVWHKLCSSWWTEMCIMMKSGY